MSQSKMVSYQLKYSRAVIAVGRLQAAHIGESIRARFGPDSVDAEALASEILRDCDLLAAEIEAFSAAGIAVSEAKTAGLLARTERDKAKALVAKLVAAIRTRVHEHLGQEAVRLYKLDERVPTGREALGGYAAKVHALLEAYPRTAEDLFCGTFDTAPLAARLGPAVEQYQALLSKATRAERELQKARYLRDKAEQRFRSVLVNVAAVIESRLRMANLDALADRVRPTYARASGEVEVAMPEETKADTATAATATDPAGAGSDAGNTTASNGTAAADVSRTTVNKNRNATAGTSAHAASNSNATAGAGSTTASNRHATADTASAAGNRHATAGAKSTADTGTTANGPAQAWNTGRPAPTRYTPAERPAAMYPPGRSGPEPAGPIFVPLGNRRLSPPRGEDSLELHDAPNGSTYEPIAHRELLASLA